MRQERPPSRPRTGAGLEAELGLPRARWTTEDPVDPADWLEALERALPQRAAG